MSGYLIFFSWGFSKYWSRSKTNVWGLWSLPAVFFYKHLESLRLIVIQTKHLNWKYISNSVLVKSFSQDYNNPYETQHALSCAIFITFVFFPGHNWDKITPSWPVRPVFCHRIFKFSISFKMEWFGLVREKKSFFMYVIWALRGFFSFHSSIMIYKTGLGLILHLLTSVLNLYISIYHVYLEP